jgi:hypothetical protein
MLALALAADGDLPQERLRLPPLARANSFCGVDDELVARIGRCACDTDGAVFCLDPKAARSAARQGARFGSLGFRSDLPCL